MSNLRTLQQEVEEILVKHPETRASDNKLYGIYLIDKIGLESAITFFVHFEEYGDRVAPYESVSRCRRKAQEEHPELRPPKEIQDARDELQGTFFDYARGL